MKYEEYKGIFKAGDRVIAFRNKNEEAYRGEIAYVDYENPRSGDAELGIIRDDGDKGSGRNNTWVVFNRRTFWDIELGDGCFLSLEKPRVIENWRDEL